MKYLLLFVLAVLLFNPGYCQTEPFDTLLNKGKSQFKNDLEKPDYNYAIKNLKKAVDLNPNSSEAHYFLAYAYSRFNSSDGSTIPEMKIPLVLKASDELEKVNSLSPLYKGEVIVLDPYSKLTSEWGAMALSYIVNHKPDSAKWAFEEGKKRGGFDEFILGVNRAVLNSCSQNSILISSGDNYTFSLCYLQTIEKLRTDVNLIDIDMIGNNWYPKFLEQTTQIKFGIKEPILDTIGYEKWPDSTISIPISKSKIIFSWLLKPTYEGHYILRGDRLLMSLLKENKFKRDVFFTKDFIASEQIGLTDYLLNYPIVDKLNATNDPQLSNEQYITGIKNLISTLKAVNPNSADEQTPIDGIRYDIIKKLRKSLETDSDPTTDEFYELLKDYLPQNKYPCNSPELLNYLKSTGIN